MLHYFVLASEDLMLTSIVIGLIYAWVNKNFGHRARNILHIGVLAGGIASIGFAYIKNAFSGRQSQWNLYTYSAGLIVFVLFIIFCALAINQKRKTHQEKTLTEEMEMERPLAGVEKTFSIVAAAFIFVLLIINLPDVYLYPFKFNLGSSSVLSSAFFTRLMGWLLAIILMILLAISIYRTGFRIPSKALSGVFIAGLAINAIKHISALLQVLYTRRIVTGHALFVFLREATNRSYLFLFAAIIVAIIVPIVLFIHSAGVKEPYSNPAEHRKIRSKWRNARRWAGTTCIALLVGVLTLTWFTALDNQEVELSPIEDSEVRGNSVYVPLEAVEDGHLHRFAYTTDNDVEIRFIVIKKPNSSSYGVGLDACDICGETGYFERNGQIVCKLCDVVMNVNTIGFKGGCNPIVVDYSVDSGYIVVPIEGMVAYESEFK